MGIGCGVNLKNIPPIRCQMPGVMFGGLLFIWSFFSSIRCMHNWLHSLFRCGYCYRHCFLGAFAGWKRSLVMNSVPGTPMLERYHEVAWIFILCLPSKDSIQVRVDICTITNPKMGHISGTCITDRGGRIAFSYCTSLIRFDKVRFRCTRFLVQGNGAEVQLTELGFEIGLQDIRACTKTSGSLYVF